MSRPARARLTGFDPLESREVPATLATGPLADLTTRGADAFPPYSMTPAGVTAGGTTYFVAATATSALGLFRTDGTQAGTTLVKDLASPASPWGLAPTLTAVGDKVVFAYDDGKTGLEPWVTDGTAAGTKLLADITPGPTGTSLVSAITLGGKAVLSVASGAYNSVPQLWATDGTPAGTVKLGDLSATYPPGAPAVANGRLYYPVNTFGPDGAFRTDIVVTDGTAAGTKTLASLPAGVTANLAYDPTTAWAAGTADGSLVFAASDMDSGAEPWVVRKDGTAGRLSDLNTMPSPWQPTEAGGATLGSNPTGFTALGGRVYFAADDGKLGQELYSTDGSTDGTVLTADLSPKVGSVDPSNPGTIDPVTGMWSIGSNGSMVHNLRAANGRLFLAATDGSGDGIQLFATDGTAAPVKVSTDGLNGGDPRVVGTAGPTTVVSTGGRLWATDGTTATPLTEQAPSPGFLFSDPVTAVALAPGKLYYTAPDAALGRQLFVTDGTPAGTKLAAVVNDATVGSDPRLFAPIGKTAVFVGQSADGNQSTLYSTDGTSAPTPIVQTVDYIGAVVPVGAKAFAVASGVATAKLWVTDGTTAGTSVLYSLDTAPSMMLPGFGAANIGNPTAVGDKLFFTVQTLAGATELWASDGTKSGTAKVATVLDYSASPVPIYPMANVRGLTAVGDKLYFAVNGGQDDDVVWVSDGIEKGTRRVKDGGANGQNPADLTALGGKLYYTAASGDAGRQLWVTDGTAAGTKQAAEINFGSRKDDQLSYNYGLGGATLAVGGKLYLPIGDAAAGRQLGVYDPATGAVLRLTNTGATNMWGPDGSYTDAQPADLTAADGRVYFTAAGTNGARQVFVTDGTAAGTRVVRELTPDLYSTSPSMPGASGPDILAVTGKQAVFAADDGKSGRELWITDGTAGGTRLAREFAPGVASGLMPAWGDPQTATVVNNRLLLAAAAPKAGVEPWAVPLADLASTPHVTVPPTVPVVPPVNPPPVTPPNAQTAGTATPAAVVRTFAVRATQWETFTGNLATVTLPEASGYSATVDWGDGKPAAATLTRGTATGKTWTVSATRTLAAAGTSKPTVTITRGGATVLTTKVDATVAEAKFYAVRVAQKVTAGAKFSGAVATVDDLGKGMTAADLTASIAWGDGTTSTGTLKRNAAGKLEVVGDHTFKEAGSRTVTVTVSGVGSTRVQTAASTFAVAAAPKPVTPPPAPAAEVKFYALRVAQRVTAGASFKGAVAVIDDLGKTTAASTYTATIKWGDGSTSAGTVKRNAAGRLEVVGEHTFKAAGKPTVSVTVTAGKRVQTADSLFTVDAKKK